VGSGGGIGDDGMFREQVGFWSKLLLFASES
jgi:hypothetical protein